jgi:protein-disulfide isomerase|tara:strand:+ start:133 stop:723 length:591 start_codon:yes stop_codon:yes gene_type:complete
MIKNITHILLFLLLLTSSLYSNEEKKLSLGDKNANITIKVFSSLTCPHCANFHNKIFEKLKIEYIDTKKVKFEHHGFPLDMAALNAEKILRSVDDGEKSFQFLTEIYKKQDQWAVGSDIKKINEKLKKIGLDFGLNAKLIDESIEDKKVEEQILNERINAQKKYNITSTPTIYINKKKYEGKHEFKLFKKTLDKLL